MESLNYEELAVLVEQSKQGDRVAFARLYQTLSPKIYFFALNLVKNKVIAEDVVQETFANALVSLHTLENNLLFTAWLNRIAYRVAIRFLKRNQEQVLAGAQMEALVNQLWECQDNDPFELVSKQEWQDQIQRAVDQLHMAMRSVVLLYYYHDMKLQDIATVLDCPLGTVKSRLRIAKDRLRQSIAAVIAREKSQK